MEPNNSSNQNNQNPMQPGDTISPQPLEGAKQDVNPAANPIDSQPNAIPTTSPAQSSIDAQANINATFTADIQNQPAQQVIPSTPQAPFTSPQETPQNPNLTIVNNVPKQKKSPVAAIIIILLIILLAGGGAAAYFILGRNNTTTGEQQSNNDITTSADTTAATKIFKNDEFKFQFTYPESWGDAVIESGKLLEQQKGKYNEISFAANENIKINLVLDPYGSPVDGCGYNDAVKNAQAELISKKASVIGWELKDIKRYVLDFNGQGSNVANTVKVNTASSNPSERWTEISAKDNILEYKNTEQAETQVKATTNTEECGPVTQAQADEANSYSKFFYYAANKSSSSVKGVNAYYDARKSDDPKVRAQIIDALNSIQFTN